MRFFFRKPSTSKNKQPASAKGPQTADWNTKFGGALGYERVRLHYWPAYKNPYQTLFYGSDTSQFIARANPIEAALEDLQAHPKHLVCFHLHWLNFLFRDPETIKITVAEFLETLRRFCDAGGVLVWTVHNLTEHDREEDAFEVDLRQQIAQLSTAVFVHGPAAADTVCSALSVGVEKIRSISHGSYIGCYPDTVTPETARTTLQLDREDTVFLSLGWVRRYKGLEALCTALESCTDARLVIAGSIRPRDKADLEGLFADFRRTVFFEGWVADHEIQTYMNAADFVVLPYLASLTSGAALLALSFGVPIIAPRIGAFPEVIQDGKTGFLYDPEETEGLRGALDRARASTPEARAFMRVAAFDAASALTWSPARLALFQSLASAAPRP